MSVPPAPRGALPCPPSAVLFDLDGTLTDPKPGITGCFRRALIELGLPAPDPDDLHWVIGPPLRQSFLALTGSDATADEGVAIYRRHYDAGGLFENAVIPGIPELLVTLADAGIVLHVATSKPWPTARRILAHFGLADPFRAIYGSEFDGTRADKRDLLRHVVAQERLDPAAAVMIGDREHDVIGADVSGIRTIGVRWGYGSDAELLGAGAAALVDHPDDIRALLLP